mmetsp:Transcript_16455/g.19976  ORF Transcript_16455/g.19976 Transcript_16455/m.19976 type:complete len:145 (-) Transcript_16455:52-486(-)
MSSFHSGLSVAVPVLKPSWADIWFGSSRLHVELNHRTISFYVHEGDKNVEKYFQMLKSVLSKIESSVFKGKKIADLQFESVDFSSEYVAYSIDEARRRRVKPWFASAEIEARSDENEAAAVPDHIQFANNPLDLDNFMHQMGME